MKINSIKILSIASMILISTCFSCEESGKKEGDEAKAEETKTSKVKAPEINIQLAILSDNVEAVKQHIEAGTDINAIDAMSGSSPLITAAFAGRSEIAELLIEADADLSIKNNDGATALHTAAFFCRQDIVKSLLKAGADKNAKNNMGATALQTISGDFKDIKSIYEMMKVQFEPMGVILDIDRIEETRPLIASLLN